jgi:hypothetical protein
MAFKVTGTEAYADLGEVWLRDQTARLLQKHLQFEHHWRLDFDSLLAQIARNARTARASALRATIVRPFNDQVASPTHQTVEHRAPEFERPNGLGQRGEFEMNMGERLDHL